MKSYDRYLFIKVLMVDDPKNLQTFQALAAAYVKSKYPEITVAECIDLALDNIHERYYKRIH
jgi:hypothetical protein